MTDYFVETTIAGVTFEGRQAQLEEEHVGNEITLKREPANRYDKNAIAVWSRQSKKQLGYVPRRVAAELAPIMDRQTKMRATIESIGRVENGYGPLGASIEIRWSGKNAA